MIEMMETLKNRVKSLAVSRVEVAALKVQIESARLDLESTNEYRKVEALRDVLKSMNDMRAVKEDDLREMALEIGEEIGEKKLLAGVEINKAKVFEVMDEHLALEWAKKNLPQALTLDKTTFKKLVMVLPDAQRPNPEIVKVKEVEYGKVRLASDLSFYVVEGDARGMKWLPIAMERGWVEDRAQFVAWMALSPWEEGVEDYPDDDDAIQRWFEQVSIGVDLKKMHLWDAVQYATKIVKEAVDG